MTYVCIISTDLFLSIKVPFLNQCSAAKQLNYKMTTCICVGSDKVTMKGILLGYKGISVAMAIDTPCH